MSYRITNAETLLINFKKIYLLYFGKWFYIGSTKNSLRTRLNQHRAHSKQGRSALYNKMRLTGADKWNIKLLSMCPSQADACFHENNWIKDNLNNEYCLNQKRAYQTKEERLIQMRVYFANYPSDKKEAAFKKYYRKKKKEKTKVKT